MRTRKNIKRDTRIKYLIYKSGDMVSFLPMVNIVLTHKGICFHTVALVDSGATSTFIPLCLSKELGIELKVKNDHVTGAGGNFSAYITKIENLKVIKGQTTLTEFNNLIIRVPSKEDGIPFIILGRDSIFRRFSIRFDEHKQELHLQIPAP